MGSSYWVEFFIKKTNPSIELSKAILAPFKEQKMKIEINKVDNQNIPNVTIDNPDGHYSKEKYFADTIEEAIKLLGNKSGSLSLLLNDRDYIAIHLCPDGQVYGHEYKDFGTISLWIQDYCFIPPKDSEEYKNDWGEYLPPVIDILNKAIDQFIPIIKPIYGYGHSDGHISNWEEGFKEPDNDDLVNNKVNHYFPLNYFSLPFVNGIGVEKIKQIPALFTKEYDDGGYLIINDVNPFHFPEVQRIEVEVMLGLRRDIDIQLYHEFIEKCKELYEKDPARFCKLIGFDEETIKKRQNLKMKFGEDIMKGPIMMDIKRAALKHAKIEKIDF